MSKPVNLAEAREQQKRAAHNRLVLETFDNFEHDDKRAQREQAEKANQKAREEL